MSSDIELLTERMKRVLDCDFDFKVPTRTAREKEEYINLYVTQMEKDRCGITGKWIFTGC